MGPQGFPGTPGESGQKGEKVSKHVGGCAGGHTNDCGYSEAGNQPVLVNHDLLSIP